MHMYMYMCIFIYILVYIYIYNDPRMMTNIVRNFTTGNYHYQSAATFLFLEKLNLNDSHILGELTSIMTSSLTFIKKSKSTGFKSKEVARDWVGISF